jgi:hypothetical protein
VIDPPASPKATRLATPGWLDGRLVLGVLLVLVSVVVGARVLSSADRSQTVWAATADLAPGTQLTADDVYRARVRLFGKDTKRYISGTGGPPVGWVLRRGVGAGELLPYAALARPGEDVAFRDVTVPVARGHLPPGLARGMQVDVYVSPERRAGAGAAPAAAAGPPAPRLVVRDVPVVQRLKTGGFSGGAGTDEPVVLRLRPAEVALVLAAMSEGRIDLVGVPGDRVSGLRTADEDRAAG